MSAEMERSIDCSETLWASPSVQPVIVQLNGSSIGQKPSRLKDEKAAQRQATAICKSTKRSNINIFTVKILSVCLLFLLNEHLNKILEVDGTSFRSKQIGSGELVNDGRIDVN